jgi:serine/threonine protein kinase
MAAPSFIAHYQITSKLGEGGMGEVWRATDTKLGREVAIKLLPDSFARDSDRMARFVRESQVLASLNHPNIAAIYGVEERALVMELVEGATLAERIARGPLDLDEVRPIIEQIIDALEYAHEKGVVHRDLKPANIKVTPEGRVKILDFGLAKAIAGNAVTSDPMTSPTLTINATSAGMILGTAAYMAPEQARGQTADKRADIWAFGVITYELLTGRQLFGGATVSDTLAAVLREEPDLAAVPVAMRTLVRHCLVKDPRKRMRDIGDARILVADVPDSANGNRRQSPRRAIVLLGVAGAVTLIAALLGVRLWYSIQPANQRLLSLSVDLGPEALARRDLTAAISPDGSRLVYSIRTHDSNMLAVRLLSEMKYTPLPGTENAVNPFFSPDGEWIAFGADGKLKKISVRGGAPITLCNGTVRGGSWGEDGFIVATLGNSQGLSRIPEDGGTPQTFTNPAQNGELTHRWPQILPGGNAVLFSANKLQSNWEEATIEVASLRTGERKTVQHGAFYGRYLPSGHLLYVRGGALYGMPWNADRLEPTGAPAMLVEDLAASTFGGGQFDFSRDGTFVYLRGRSQAPQRSILSFDTSGNSRVLLSASMVSLIGGSVAIAPDGQRLAVLMGQGVPDLWVHDLQRQTSTRLTSTGNVIGVRWTPDGRYILYGTTPGRESGLLAIRADGTEEPRWLVKKKDAQFPNLPFSLSPDGRYVIYSEQGETVEALRSGTPNVDLWSMEINSGMPEGPGTGRTEKLLAGPATENGAAVSRDGRWIAYNSTESGRPEIYVRPFSEGKIGSGGKWQVSVEGGAHAVWSPAARQLLFMTATEHIMVATWSTDGKTFKVGKPARWMQQPIISYISDANTPLGLMASPFDIMPDGGHIVAPVSPDRPREKQGNVHVVMLFNWFDELRRRLPPKAR